MNHQDIEANVFAANLLMPRRMIQKILDEHPTTTTKLAEIFEVSESDMTAWLARSQFHLTGPSKRSK